MGDRIKRFVAAYGKPKPPKEIWQEPLDGDSSHYARLCALGGALPGAGDAVDYAHDLAAQENIQAELFVCLLPSCLYAWRHDLMHNHHSDYAAYVETFSAALARRPLLEDFLEPRQAEAVMVFMRDSLLDRIDREYSLSITSAHNSAHAWVCTLGSFAVIFPELESLWRTWWGFETPGRALAAQRYISCLLYEDDANPIFAPWTPLRGGGPPSLWATDGHIYNESWKPVNIDFFKATVTPAYVHQALKRAANALSGLIESDVPIRMLSDFERQRPLLQHRLRALPEIVSRPLIEALEWPPLP